MFRLKIELWVKCEPERLVAEKHMDSLADAVTLTQQFMEKFGEPDRGAQVLTITLASE